MRSDLVFVFGTITTQLWNTSATVRLGLPGNVLGLIVDFRDMEGPVNPSTMGRDCVFFPCRFTCLRGGRLYQQG